jgi:hypothetical protein
VGCRLKKSDVKCNGEDQYDSLIENQYNAVPLSEQQRATVEPHLGSQADLKDLVHDLNLLGNQSNYDCRIERLEPSKKESF